MSIRFEIGKAIKMRRMERGLSAKQLAEMAGVPQSSLSEWENGKAVASSTGVFKICDALKISPNELLSTNPQLKESSNTLGRTIIEATNGIHSTIRQIKKHTIPVLGSIACGKPIYAEEQLECYVDTLNGMKADFALWAKGDSMKDARINDGDLVFIKQQDMVENGEIAAVLISDEATLKRVFYDEKTATLTLMAANTHYAPFIYRGDQLNDIKILGKAVAFQSVVR